MGPLPLTSAFASAVPRSPSACRLGAGAQGCSQHGARPRPPAPRAPAPRPAGPWPWRLFGRWIRCCSSAWGRPGPRSRRPRTASAATLTMVGLPARAHTRLLCRGRRAYELANHAVSARSRARGSSSTSRRGRSCAPHRASVECRAPQTFRHRVEWCGGAEPVESEHRAETRVYNTCFQTQLKTCDRSGNWPLAPRAAAAPWLVTGSAWRHILLRKL